MKPQRKNKQTVVQANSQYSKGASKVVTKVMRQLDIALLKERWVKREKKSAWDGSEET